jgi:hypothetical protein
MWVTSPCNESEPWGDVTNLIRSYGKIRLVFFKVLIHRRHQKYLSVQFFFVKKYVVSIYRSIFKIIMSTAMLLLLTLALVAVVPNTVVGQEQSIIKLTYDGVGLTPGESVTQEIWMTAPPDATTTATAPYPVFVFLQGTGLPFFEPSSQGFADEMASRGFLSALFEYNNADFCIGNPCERDAVCTESILSGKSMVNHYEKAQAIKLGMDVVCAHELANCSLGVAVMGYSQGSMTTTLLPQVDSRITATAHLATVAPYQGRAGWDCFFDSVVSQYLQRDKRIYVVGENDENIDGWTLTDWGGNYTGYTECQDATIAPIDCTQTPSGAGYYVLAAEEYGVEDRELAQRGGTELPSHAFFNTLRAGASPSDYRESDPTTYPVQFFPTFETGTKPWNLGPLCDFLATAALSESELEVLTKPGPTIAPFATSSPASSTYSSLMLGIVSPLMMMWFFG